MTILYKEGDIDAEIASLSRCRAETVPRWTQIQDAIAHIPDTRAYVATNCGVADIIVVEAYIENKASVPMILRRVRPFTNGPLCLSPPSSGENPTVRTWVAPDTHVRIVNRGANCRKVQIGTQTVPLFEIQCDDPPLDDIEVD